MDMARLNRIYTAQQKAEKNSLYRLKSFYPYHYDLLEHLNSLQDLKDARAWCAEFVQGGYIWEPGYHYTEENGNVIEFVHRIVVFADAQDAMFFKLTWL